MTGPTRVVSRRTFLRDLGHGAFALTVIGLAGCTQRAASSLAAASLAPARTNALPPRTFDPLTYVGNLDEIEAAWCTEEPPSTPPLQGSGRDHETLRRWARIGDQHAAGYVLVHGGEAAVIDTGPWCTPDVIEGALIAVGLDWSAVGSVIVTHKHPDHWVGLASALEQVAYAEVFAGAADIPHIASTRSIVAVGAGDRVMDLAIIPTPGHTPGHIAVLDEAAGVLVAGDAINYGKDRGFVLLGTSEDVPQTRASVGVLASLSFDTFLAGHGDPIIGGASKALEEYLASA